MIEGESLTTQARLTAFYEIVEELPERRRMVLNALWELGGHGTMHQVAKHMNVPLNSISGRFSELRRQEYIKAVGHTSHKPKRTIFQALVRVKKSGTPNSNRPDMPKMQDNK